MTVSAIKLLLNAYAEALAEMGTQPLQLSIAEYEQAVRLIRVYCAGWRHAKNDTKNLDNEG